MGSPYFSGPKPLAAQERLVTPKGNSPKPTAPAKLNTKPAAINTKPAKFTGPQYQGKPVGLGEVGHLASNVVHGFTKPSKPYTFTEHGITAHVTGGKSLSQQAAGITGLPTEAITHPIRFVQHQRKLTPQQKADSAIGLHLLGGLMAAPGSEKIAAAAEKKGQAVAFSGGGKKAEEAPILRAAKSLNVKLKPDEAKALQIVHEGVPIEKRIAGQKALVKAATSKSEAKAAQKELASLQAASKHVHDVNGMPRLLPGRHNLIETYAKAAKSLEKNPPTVAIPEEMTPEQQLRSTFKSLAVARGKQNAGYSAARSGVAKKLAGIHADESLTPLEKLAVGSKAMQGELPKVIINGAPREMTQDALNHLLGTVFSHPGMGEFQKHRVADALRLLVEEGRTPQPSELTLMRHIWGRDTVGSIKGAASNWSKWKNYALSFLNIPRAIESTLDQSFGLRQGLVAAAYDPKNWWKNYSHSFSYLNKIVGSGEEGYQRLIQDIHADPNFPRFQAGGLAMTDLEHEAGLREEPYQSNLAEKLVIKGHGPGNAIRAAGRGYTGAALGIRRDIANRLLDLAHSKGYNIDDEKFLHDTMSFVNAITGRGNLPTKTIRESAPLLNALFFSPRLLASRLQMLGQPFNVALLRRNPLIYRQYLKANAKTFGTLGIILATVRKFVPGASVNMNPRSSDFGKIKIGDTRIDLGGGFNQVFHQAGEQITGQKISSTTGKLQSLTSGKYGQSTRLDEFLNFLKGKESPSPGLITDFLSNKNAKHFGQPFNWTDELESKLQPLAIQDAAGLYFDPVHGLEPILAALAGYGMSGVGVGVQTYGAKKAKPKGTPQTYFSNSSSGGSGYFGNSGSGGSSYFGR